MGIYDRFDRARKLLVDDKVFIERRTLEAIYFKVVDFWKDRHGLEQKQIYNVKITASGCSCECEFGSIYGMSDKKLPCYHIIAAMSLIILEKNPVSNKTEADNNNDVVPITT
jgi:hypothetical protein